MLFQQLLIRSVLRKKYPQGLPPGHKGGGPVLRFALRLLRRQLTNTALVVAGIFSAALGLKGFLLPNGFIDGGVTGISLLTAQVTGVPLSVLILVINAPFVVLAYFQLDRVVAVKTLLAITGLAVVLWLVSFPVLTHDKLLISVFGGFFLGAGIGLTIRGGGVLDGTEILSVFISRKSPMSVGDVILVINIFIFGVAALLLSVEAAMYSILAYLSAAKTVDFMIDGLEEYTGVTIISKRSEAIRRVLTENLGHGVTIYSGRTGYSANGVQRQSLDIVFTAVTRLELTRLKAEVEAIDHQAFILMHSIKDTHGGVIKKKPLH
ncbi:YitT family protein [Hymenobacter latericus]|uniref:YitT family protein n=1 Tax=Hymenobacter sp. YIM 151858-1 TaxID=2987688 RepID=UPI0022262E02|nr:YitT family protein [Hymenobacter sp. YIM 151858-1]UYZ61023.1 YitT family protein [Hymenobacter sp. YIM 151858-1]